MGRGVCGPEKNETFAIMAVVGVLRTPCLFSVWHPYAVKVVGRHLVSVGLAPAPQVSWWECLAHDRLLHAIATIR